MLLKVHFTNHLVGGWEAVEALPGQDGAQISEGTRRREELRGAMSSGGSDAREQHQSQPAAVGIACIKDGDQPVDLGEIAVGVFGRDDQPARVAVTDDKLLDRGLVVDDEGSRPHDAGYGLAVDGCAKEDGIAIPQGGKRGYTLGENLV